MIKNVVVLVFCLFFAVGSAHAMNLTSSDMEKFIKTYTQLGPYFDALDDYDDDDGDDFNVAVLKQRYLESFAGHGEMQSIVRSNGYSSVEEFSGKAAHIIMAYMAYSGMGQFDELERSMASMSPEEQQQFKNSPVYQMISETKKQFASVPESHIQAVTPYISQLHELFDLEDEEY